MTGRWGLTRTGVGFCVLGLGVGAAVTLTGDPLLGGILWGQLATLAAAAVLSRRNLAGLRGARCLPGELFAEVEAHGELVLVNPGSHPALQVRVGESHGTTSARFAAVAGHGRQQRPVQWRFRDRGRHTLAGLVLSSDYPFGLIYQRRHLSLSAELVVYPYPDGQQGTRSLPGAGDQESSRSSGIGEGDFQGLREYVAGDPVRRLHWPTTARAGRPIVVVTSARACREVIVEVAEGRGEVWERSLRAATAGVERHFRDGAAVGLRLEGELLVPRADRDWRRVLLERLALAGRRRP